MLGRRLARQVTTITMAAALPLLGMTAAPAGASTATVLAGGMAKLAATYGTGGPDLFGSGGFGWQNAIAQSTVEAYEAASGDRSYFPYLAATYSEYVNSDPRGGFPDFEDDYVDDTGWWGLAWLEGYKLTGNADYLKVAEADATFMYDKGWNTDANVCGGKGGEYWYIPAGAADAGGAVQNEVFLDLTAWLYNETKDSQYLTWADDDWAWFQNSGLIGSNYLVANNTTGSPSTSCGTAGPNWLYNQGTILGGLAQLYLATGNSSLLTEAEHIATAVINSSTLDPSGVLLEPCTSLSLCPGNPDSYKGIFVQNLRELASIVGTTQYNTFLSNQAAAVGGTDINSSSQFGMFWDAPLSAGCSSIKPASLVSNEADNYCNSATQASGLDALIAADTQTPATFAQVEASAGSGYCLDNTDNSSSNANPIQIWQCNGDAAQKWTFIPDRNGVSGEYMLENSNGKCLDDPDDSKTDGTKVQLWMCLGNPNQEWRQVTVGSYIEYVNSNGMCLDDTGNSHADGTRVQVWSCLGDTAQQWEGPA
jgi:hypothetical protein